MFQPETYGDNVDMIQKAMSHHHLLWVNQRTGWPCSSSRTVSHYQRVTIVIRDIYDLSWLSR